ncbi:MAG: DNA/RNA nuclease SfsA [Candidatus Woesearchaeota archaeon]
MKKLLFEEELIPGLIKSRPNRFIMFVEINHKLEKCHCPSTGKIGNIEFKDIPCLLSESNNKERKTKYTVEAINPIKNIWVGINQTKANNYLEFFLKNNLLKDMIEVGEIKREVKLNTSRIDFLINNNCFLEVKTPLTFLPFGNKPGVTKFNSFERLGRHFTDISSQISKGQRAIVLLCYLYNAEPFKVPEKPDAKIINLVKKATKKGLENWQINFKIDKKGVSLIDYFRLKI